MSHSGITDILSTLSIKSLTDLDLTANSLESLIGIESLPDLTALKIGEMFISNLAMIPSIADLEYLELGCIHSYQGQHCNSPRLETSGLLENIDRLTELRTLKATNVGIANAKKIEALSNLKVLDLSCNRIAETDIFEVIAIAR